jgi:hypothetical protein
VNTLTAKEHCDDSDDDLVYSLNAKSSVRFADTAKTQQAARTYSYDESSLLNIIDEIEQDQQMLTFSQMRLPQVNPKYATTTMDQHQGVAMGRSEGR